MTTTPGAMRSIVLGCALLALAACGTSTGGDGDRAVPSTGAPAPRVLVIGDSNLFDSSAEVDAALRAAGVEPTLRGVPYAGVRQLDFWREEITGQPEESNVVVVGLGTNDAAKPEDVAQFPSRLDAIMEAIGDRPVIWLTHVDVRPAAPVDAGFTVNEHIREAATRWPNLTVLDFTAEMDADPTILAADGLHFSPHGKAVYAAAITATVLSVLELPAAAPPPARAATSRG